MAGDCHRDALGNPGPNEVAPACLPEVTEKPLGHFAFPAGNSGAFLNA